MPSSATRLSACSLALFVGLPMAAQAPATDFLAQLLAQQSRTAFTIQGTGGRAVGTGGAFIAVADDATAVSFNPAGLAQLLRPEFSLVGESLKREQSLSGLNTANQANPNAFDDDTTSDRRVSPLFFSAAVPFKRGGRNTVLQVSYQRIIDLGYDSSSSFRSKPQGNNPGTVVNQAIEQDGGIGLWSLAVGTELTPRLLFGASINHWRGNWDFQATSTFNVGLPGQLDLELGQRNEFRGWNYNLGLLWRFQYLNAGLVYRSPFKADYTVDTSTVFDSTNGPDTVRPPGHVSATLKWPESMGIGLSFHPSDRFTLSADVTRTRWSRAILEAPDEPTYDNVNYFDLRKNSRTPDTKDTRAGFEWVVFLGERVIIPIRAGVFKEPQPIVDPDTRQQRIFKGYTAGFGLKFRSVNLDLAFKHSLAERDVTQIIGVEPGTTLTAKVARGREEIKEDRVYLSAMFQLDTAKVQRMVRWLMVGE